MTQPLHWEYIWLDDKTIFEMQEGSDMFYLAHLAHIMDNIMSVGDVDPPPPIVHCGSDKDPLMSMGPREMLDYTSSPSKINQLYVNGCSMFVQGRLAIFDEEQRSPFPSTALYGSQGSLSVVQALVSI
ncbi:hypothetical protein OG21DRAFT_1491205 [Imleria badia]|nr:hypothetical protein OG21DRAFT_1491205 [Imleria badia]